MSHGEEHFPQMPPPRGDRILKILEISSIINLFALRAQEGLTGRGSFPQMPPPRGDRILKILEILEQTNATRLSLVQEWGRSCQATFAMLPFMTKLRVTSLTHVNNCL